MPDISDPVLSLLPAASPIRDARCARLMRTYASLRVAFRGISILKFRAIS